MKWTPLDTRLQLKTTKLLKWHRWFAWLPVTVKDKTVIGESSVVWLAPVMRRLRPDYLAPMTTGFNTHRFYYMTVDTFTADLLTGDSQ